MIRKISFKKHNIPRDRDSLSFKIKDFVTLSYWRIAYEDVRGSYWGKFLAPLFEFGNIS